MSYAAYIGEIRTVGFNFTPVNWVACNGQSLPISQYQALFQLIGTTYGGDGVNTFNVPDLRGRVMPHTRGGAGLTNYIAGQTGGQETVTLNTTQIPVHQHPYSVGLAASTSGTLSDDPAGRRPGVTKNNTYAGSSQIGKNLATNALSTTVAAAGGNQPHSNIQPVLSLNFIMCAEGIYPPLQP